MSQIVIGTAGHIDHGKTALVKALTGVDTDRLQEEKAHGMTIDIGFAFLNDEITIIDVPGHEKFIRNMVAGVSTIQVVLLVIAADDGIMPQTLEHLQIISLLGIPRGVIALTKTDLAEDSDWLDLVEEEIRDSVNGTVLASAPIVRTSVIPESGIEELRQALLTAAQAVRQTRDRGFFRMPVDRSFIKTGFGVVTTGTVLSGKLTVGDEIECLPKMVKCKVRGLQSHGRDVTEVVIGDRAAVNLAGLDKSSVWRGCVLATRKSIDPTTGVIANVSLIPGSKWELKSGQRIRIHLGTAEVLGRVTIQGKVLKPGQSGNIIIRLEKPVVAVIDDRFVIRSYSPLETIGGGTILDPHIQGNRNKIVNWTSTLSTDRNERFGQFIRRYAATPKPVTEWSTIFYQTEEQILGLVAANGFKVLSKSNIIIDPDVLPPAMDLVKKRLEIFHKKNPYRPSLNGDIIKNELGFSPLWMDYVTQRLICANVISIVDAGYALQNHNISLSSKDLAFADLLAGLLKKSGLSPLTVKELAESAKLDETRVVELLHVLKNQNNTLDILQGLWMDRNYFNKLTAELSGFFAKKEKLTVPDFKAMTGLTRKNAIPLLEYLDKKGFTERAGNDRIKGKNS